MATVSIFAPVIVIKVTSPSTSSDDAVVKFAMTLFDTLASKLSNVAPP